MSLRPLKSVCPDCMGLGTGLPLGIVTRSQCDVCGIVYPSHVRMVGVSEADCLSIQTEYDEASRAKIVEAVDKINSINTVPKSEPPITLEDIRKSVACLPPPPPVTRSLRVAMVMGFQPIAYRPLPVYDPAKIVGVCSDEAADMAADSKAEGWSRIDTKDCECFTLEARFGRAEFNVTIDAKGEFSAWCDPEPEASQNAMHVVNITRQAAEALRDWLTEKLEK